MFIETLSIAAAGILALWSPTFSPAERTVSTWRLQALRHLVLTPEQQAGLAFGGDRNVTRCVRLNNYWCIKGIGWTGMLAADAEGHVAFASAEEGAAVAALLLRRYYRDYTRRSAAAIVARWAPAQCGFSPAAKPGGHFAIAQKRNRLGPAPRPHTEGLAARGLGNTLRARFLASRHGLRGTAQPTRRATVRRSVVADRVGPLMRAPTIAVGMGETTLVLPALKFGTLAAAATLSIPALPDCSGDSVRIANYAQKASTGVAAPDDDLMLFDAAGNPTPNLARVMENMSGVEIGPLRADPALVRAGIAAALRAWSAAEAARSVAAGAATP